MKVSFKGFKEDLELEFRYRENLDSSISVWVVADTCCDTIPFLLEMEEMLKKAIPFQYTQEGDSRISKCYWAHLRHAHKMQVSMMIRPGETVRWTEDWNVVFSENLVDFC